MGRARVVVVLVVAACKFTGPAPGEVTDVDAPPMFDDAGREIRLWNFDTAEEWGIAGHRAIGMTLEPRGSLTPDGYIYGGLIVRGVDGMKLFEHANPGWFATTQAATATGAGLWNGQAFNAGQDLRFAGVTGTGPRTLVLEGELFFTANETRAIRVEANDVAYVEIAEPGTDRFTTVFESDTVTSFTAPTTGWYPVRTGYADSDDGGSFRFQIDDATIARNRMRAPTKALQGTLRTVFFRQMHTASIRSAVPPVGSIEAGDLTPRMTFVPSLQGALQVPAATAAIDWSARWSGQIYIAMPGTYGLSVDSDDGNRLVVDGIVDEVGWARGFGVGNARSEVSLGLTEGWHDLTIDYNQVSGEQGLNAQIDAAPDATLVGAPIPASILRPVVSRGDRLVTFSSFDQIDPPGGSTEFTNVTIPISAFPGETITAVELTARYTTGSNDDVDMRLTAPGRTAVDVFQGQGGGGVTNRVEHVRSTNQNLIGGEANGDWIFGVRDDNSGGSATEVDEVHLTIHTQGGLEQIALASEYLSEIIDHETRLFAIDSITWDERLAPAGSSVTVHMRSCDEPDCSDAAFGPAIEKGVPPALEPRRYMQLQVRMTSDGTREPELRSINIVYRRDVM